MNNLKVALSNVVATFKSWLPQEFLGQPRKVASEGFEPPPQCYSRTRSTAELLGLLRCTGFQPVLLPSWGSVLFQHFSCVLCTLSRMFNVSH